MIRLLSFLLLISAALSCKDISNVFNDSLGSTASTPVDTILYSQPTSIVFKDTFVDIGNVKQGEEMDIAYYYTNNGDKPLMLFGVSPSCGCTIADFSRKPLAVGLSDSIVAKFDSKGKEGSYQKTIKVNCNSEQKNHNLFFKVNVTK